MTKVFFDDVVQCYFCFLLVLFILFPIILSAQQQSFTVEVRLPVVSDQKQITGFSFV